MAGNHRSGGHNAKSAQQHRLQGNFRENRHAHLAALDPDDSDDGESLEPLFTPPWFSDTATAIHDLLAKQLGEAVQATDSIGLVLLCETLSLWQTALVEAKKDPTDKVARSSVVAYATVCDRLLSKYGLTPADRTRLKLSPKSSANDTLNVIPKRSRDVTRFFK